MRPLPAEPAMLDVLRTATRADHLRLDQLPLIRRLLAPDPAATSYRRFMQRLQQSYAAIEPALTGHGTALSGHSAYRPRLPAIHRELEQLGADTLPELKNAGLPADSEAAYWGLRYVVDGSCHGARRLQPVLCARPELQSRTDFAYWQVLLGIAPHWPGLIEGLESSGRDPIHRRIMVDAAHTAFALFIGCFAGGAR